METNFQKIYKTVGLAIIIAASFFSVTKAQWQKSSDNFQFFSTDKFSFEFKNNHSVKKFQDIWYVQNNKTKQTNFVIFEKSKKIFNEKLFECGSFFDRSEYCYSKTGVGTVVKNVLIKDRTQATNSFTRVGEKAFNFFKKRDFAQESQKGLEMVTRAEALKFILDWRDPGKKYDQYKAACFDDISAEHPLSGQICYAEKQGIIQGISGKFFPDLSINLWGTLKIAHKVFEIPVEKFENWALVESKPFAEMSTEHGATDIIAHAYLNGIIRATENLSFWPNTAINRGEFLSILYRFHRWKTGTKLKEFLSDSDQIAPPVYRENLSVSFKAKPFKDAENEIEGAKRNIEWKQVRDRLIVYDKISDGVFQYLFSLKIKSDVKSVDLWWVEKDFEGTTKIVTEHDTKILFEITPHKKLLEKLPKKNSAEQKQFLTRNNWLPNQIKKPTNVTIPVVKIFMDPIQFEEILTHRTARERYLAWLEIEFPSGQKIKRAIRIKTRGNATIGYIKPSLTIETFKKFKTDQIPFLKDGNEFKLRSFVNDESMISEKLFYDSFKNMNYPAPNFEPVLVELNGESFGLYQLTEPIKKLFFATRDIFTDDYFYAQNSGSKYNTNLKKLPTDSLTLSQYKIRGNRHKLLAFINSINNDVTNPAAINSIDVPMAMDYLLLTHVASAWDNLTHNYYVYLDARDKKWKIFPWDADESFTYGSRPIVFEEFKKYFASSGGNFNQLYLYLSNHLSDDDIKKYIKNFEEKFSTKNVLKMVEFHQETLREYFDFDNDLWNGKFIERKKSVMETNKTIDELREKLSE